MVRLELKHIAPYLPYRLRINTDYDGIQEINGMPDLFHVSYYDNDSDNGDELHIEDIKPILRSLSDLTKEIEVNGERFVPVEWFEIGDDGEETEFDHGNIKLIKSLKHIYENNCFHDIHYLPFAVVQKLIEWNFDFNGLIEKGLAIDINSLEKW